MVLRTEGLKTKAKIQIKVYVVGRECRADENSIVIVVTSEQKASTTR